MPVPSDVAVVVRSLFASPPVLAVLGAHPTRHRAAHYVPAYLADRGAHIVPVNPRYAGTALLGATCLPDLATAAGHPRVTDQLDAVVVFRSSAALPGHLDELLAVRPRVVWLQQGIRHDAVAKELRAAGITVVQDRCLKVDHARVLGF